MTAVPLLRDRRGTALTEFALLLPVFAALLMGSLDMGHRLYARAILQGSLQKAARDSALEAGTTAARQAALDARVTAAVRDVHRDAAVTTSRLSYRTFRDAERRHEPYTDGNRNGRCDAGEPYTDIINRGQFDADIGQAGQGGAQDVVIYSARMVYPTITPVQRLIGGGPNVDLTASAVIRNQPYNDQGGDGAPGSGNCR